MRRIILAGLSVAAVSVLAAGAASAADGCIYDRYGRLVCAPGAQPGVEYRGGRREALPHRFERPHRYWRRGCPPGYLTLDGGRVCIRD